MRNRPILFIYKVLYNFVYKHELTKIVGTVLCIKFGNN